MIPLSHKDKLLSTKRIGSLHMRQMGVLPTIVKQRLKVKYDSGNTLLPPESACGIHVLNEVNRSEFLLA